MYLWGVADNTAKIAAIDEILDRGAKRVVVDGQTVEYDFAELRRRRTQLVKDDDATTTANKRPRSAQINLGGAW